MYPYIGEILVSQTRSKLMTLIGFAMGLGMIYSTGIGWLLQRLDVKVDIAGYYILFPWRIQMILAVIPGFVAVLLYYSLPESPKFISSTQKEQNVLRVLKEIHLKNGNFNDFPIQTMKEGSLDNSNKKTL